MTQPFATALRLYETVRHLKPEQVYGRLWFRLAKPRPDLRPAPGLRPRDGAWVEPAARRPSLTAPGVFRLLNEAGDVALIGWDGPQREKLWRYNQHYFEDLTATQATARRAWHAELLSHWLAANPPGKGVGWEPYPLSLRIVNWIKAGLAGPLLTPPLRHSLAVQARFLTRRLERHLLGNHLFANAKALIFAGLFFEGDEALGWRRIGFSILARQFDEQILPDGGQFERSPMYHALALDDVLDLVNLTQAFGAALTAEEAAAVRRWRAAVAPMRAWLEALCHPDGEISFFNDAAIAIAPPRAALEAYAARLGLPAPPTCEALTFLQPSGYARLSVGEAVALCDLAPVGPDYLPGHAHADTLSFEASLFGERVIVNSGTSQYGLGPERLRQRGAAAHSTVVVAGQNSSDVWSGFRVGARARVRNARVFSEGAALVAEGEHDGYRRLPGRPWHHRRWTLQPGRLQIADRVQPGALPAEAFFHLHPAVRATQDTAQDGALVLASGKTVRWRAAGGPVRVEDGSWHPEFGKSIANQRLVLPLAGGVCALDLLWA